MTTQWPWSLICVISGVLGLAIYFHSGINVLWGIAAATSWYALGRAHQRDARKVAA